MNIEPWSGLCLGVAPSATGVLRHGPDIPAVRDAIISWQRDIAEQIGAGATVRGDTDG